MRLLPYGLLVLAAIHVGTPARAQMDSREAIGLQNQLLELRRDLQMLQAQRGGYVAPPPVPRGGGGGEIAAQLLDRVQALEDQVRQQQGQIDQLANAQRRQTEELAKQIADMNFRLGNGAGGGGAPAYVPPPGPPPNISNPGLPPQAGGGRRPPELAMQEGNAALARRDYPMAETAAREVLAGGRGPRATDAQFLLAQALAGRRDYQGAAIAYDDAYTRNRAGPRAPDALLGVAVSMAALNEGAAACASLEKLRLEYPVARPDVKQAATTLRTRAGCR